MSIEKVEMFTVVCDNCKKSADENTDYSCWNCENGAQDVAMEAGYLKEEDKHYCPDCFEYDDDDNLIIKVNPLNTYTVEMWYRYGDNQKEFMQRNILAESPEKALELASLIRRNIFSVKIIKTESYTERIDKIVKTE